MTQSKDGAASAANVVALATAEPDDPTPEQIARRAARQKARDEARREEAKLKAEAWAKAKADAWIKEKAERHERRRAEHKAEQKAARERKLAEDRKGDKAAAKAKPSVQPIPTADPAAEPARPIPTPIGLAQRTRTARRSWTAPILFVLLVVIPTAAVAYFYAFVATPQFQSQMSFAVRGTQSSPLATLGLSALPGSDTQASDAYIVTEYVKSLQLLKDLKRDQNIDVRSFFAQRWIDPVYRVEPDAPLEEFHSYWNWMADADYNSTTSITSFQVNAFSSADAATISDAVLKAAIKLVNELSAEAQEQLIATATQEVERTQKRLSDTRENLANFRNSEQSVDPTLQAQSDQELIQGIEKEIIELRARRAALLASVNASSPTVRVIDRQLRSLDAELAERRRIIGSGTSDASGTRVNRSSQFNTFDRLTVEREFAEKAYTTALSSLEQSQAEARKQERYFAIVVSPTKPSVALYPLSIINTLLFFVGFFMLWLVIYLVVQNVRDHAA